MILMKSCSPTVMRSMNYFSVLRSEREFLHIQTQGKTVHKQRRSKKCMTEACRQMKVIYTTSVNTQFYIGSYNGEYGHKRDFFSVLIFSF